jgi:CD109 antigen
MSLFQVILYFESLGRSEVCPTISAYRTYKVANQRPSSVLVYDYYDQSRRARAFYQADPTSLCDICDDCPIDADCGDRPTFLNLESFQFGTNVDLPGSAPGGTAMSMVAFLAFLMPILLL